MHLYDIAMISILEHRDYLDNFFLE